MTQEKRRESKEKRASRKSTGSDASTSLPRSSSRKSIASSYHGSVSDRPLPENGALVSVVVDDKDVAQGTVRFVGETKFASGIWVGIELAKPLGKNDGMVRGVTYFTCAPMHGLFVRPGMVFLPGQDLELREALSRRGSRKSTDSLTLTEPIATSPKQEPTSSPEARAGSSKKRKNNKGMDRAPEGSPAMAASVAAATEVEAPRLPTVMSLRPPNKQGNQARSPRSPRSRSTSKRKRKKNKSNNRNDSPPSDNPDEALVREIEQTGQVEKRTPSQKKRDRKKRAKERAASESAAARVPVQSLSTSPRARGPPRGKSQPAPKSRSPALVSREAPAAKARRQCPSSSEIARLCLRNAYVKCREPSCPAEVQRRLAEAVEERDVLAMRNALDLGLRCGVSSAEVETAGKVLIHEMLHSALYDIQEASTSIARLTASPMLQSISRGLEMESEENAMLASRLEDRLLQRIESKVQSTVHEAVKRALAVAGLNGEIERLRKTDLC